MPFDFTSIGTNLLWLEGSDAGSITESGGSISQWNDKSGGGNHADQATGARKPTFASSVQAGNSAVQFVGSDYCIEIASFAH